MVRRLCSFIVLRLCTFIVLRLLCGPQTLLYGPQTLLYGPQTLFMVIRLFSSPQTYSPLAGLSFCATKTMIRSLCATQKYGTRSLCLLCLVVRSMTRATQKYGTCSLCSSCGRHARGDFLLDSQHPFAGLFPVDIIVDGRRPPVFLRRNPLRRPASVCWSFCFSSTSSPTASIRLLVFDIASRRLLGFDSPS